MTKIATVAEIAITMKTACSLFKVNRLMGLIESKHLSVSNRYEIPQHQLVDVIILSVISKASEDSKALKTTPDTELRQMSPKDTAHAPFKFQ